jgi:hypothetical protein
VAPPADASASPEVSATPDRMPSPSLSPSLSPSSGVSAPPLPVPSSG